MKQYKLSSHHAEAYGRWAGNEKGIRADPNRCCAEVREGQWSFRQCSRPRGHGPEEAYCKTHDPASAEKRQKEQSEKFELKLQKWKLESRAGAMYKTLKLIAEGHNDPRSIAAEVIEGLGEGE